MVKKSIDEYFFEEEFHKGRKKEIKKSRKILKKTDRSKYKKTDLKKQKEISPPSKDLLKGRILSISGEGTLVSYNDQEYLCSLRGVLKKEITRNKNIIAVGDLVYFSLHNDSGIIFQVDKRYSSLIREDPVRKKMQIIAVNIDQVLITTSVIKPLLKPTLIDRYIIAAEKGKMQPIIVVNKIDLLEKSKEFTLDKIKKENEKYKEFLAAYEKTGIPIISVSCVTKVGIEALKGVMQNKASVFSGQSGTGKSSLINAILGTKLKTKEVVKKTYKGAHTTTRAKLIPLKDGGFCIDTPGIKSFGIWQLKKEEIKNHFSEFLSYAKKCKYPDCYHINEPNCAVIEAAKKNKISALRFESYRSLIKISEEENLKR